MLLDPHQGRIDIPPHSEVLQDPGGALTLAQVSSPPQVARFRPYPNREFDKGHSRAAWWLRFKVTKLPSPGQQPIWFFEATKPGVNQIDFYAPLYGGGWLAKHTGADRPRANRELIHRSFVLQVPDRFDQDRYFYVRIKSNVSVNLGLVFWTPAAYANDVVPDFFAFGAAYGVMAAMIIYNLMIFFFLKDRTYLFYVFFMTSTTVSLATTYGHLPVFLHIPRVIESKMIWLAMGMTWFTAGAFVRRFLDTATYTPRMDRAIMAMMGSSAVIIGLAFSGHDFWANMANNLVTLTGPALVMTTGIIIHRKGVRPAGYFIVAWLVMVTGAMLYCLGGVAIPRTGLTRYTLAVGTPLETLLLSLALAARIQAMRSERERLFSERKKLVQLSRTDPLTGIFNRRALTDRLPAEVELSRQSMAPMSLLMLDVDNFKHFNDTHGHPEGDKVLKALADVMRQEARDSDSAYRYGGEEFALLLPGTAAGNAAMVAERVRAAFAKRVFATADGARVSTSVSIGVAELAPGESGEDLVERSDAALYQAKEQGKNRVVTAI